MSTRVLLISDDRGSDDEGTPVVYASSAPTNSIPRLMIDDAFESGDIDDLDADADASDFDLASIIHSSQRDAGQQDNSNEDDAKQAPGSSTSINSISMRNGRAVPPPLRLVPPTLGVSTTELDSDTP